jgi:hypothetical protein
LGLTYTRGSVIHDTRMKPSSLIAIGLAASVLLFVQPNLKAATKGTTKFDGNWLVTLDAAAYKNPDGSTARPFTRRFLATVKNGVLHGQTGFRGRPNFYELNGKIEANGSANLRADLITGPKEYNFTPGSKAPPGTGTPYSYSVVARFDDRHGTGYSNDQRSRTFTFGKEG